MGAAERAMFAQAENGHPKGSLVHYIQIYVEKQDPDKSNYYRLYFTTVHHPEHVEIKNS